MSPETLFDFILNLAGLLLWVNWRSKRFDPLSNPQPASIVGTLKRTESHGLTQWKIIAVLVLLLIGRALLYCWIGSPAGWTPKLNLGFVVLAFRNSGFNYACVFLYSLLSFARILAIYNFWVLILVLIGRRTPEPDGVQKLLRIQLGPASRWPWPVALLLPLIFVVGFWVGMQPLLTRTGALAPAHSITVVLQQALLIVLALFLSLKYVLPAVLLAHLVLTYVYVGANPIWDFIGATSRNVLAPIRVLPLRIAKVDFAPLAGAVLIVALLHWVPRIIQTKIHQHHLALWPQ